MTDDQHQIVVEIPNERGYSPVPITPNTTKLEQFRRGWADAIALPDNLADLAFDLTSCVVIPALLSSCWVSLPLPDFLRLGLLSIMIIFGASLLYLRQAVPEVKDILLLRVGLIALGALLGL